MGTRLPSEEEVLIIRPAGKKGQPPTTFQPGTLRFPGALPGSPAFQSRIRTQCGPDGMQLLLSCEEHDSQKSYFPKIQGAILMKKILLTVVLGVAVVAVAQNTAQPAQGQPAAPAAQATRPAAPAAQRQRRRAGCGAGDQGSRRIQRVCGGHPAEGCQRQDQRAGSISHAVSQQRHEESGARNSDGDLPAASNVKKTMETATKLVAADPCQVPALTLLAYVDRVQAQGGDRERQAGICRRREIRPAGTGLPAEVQQAGRHERRRLPEDEGADDRKLRAGHRLGRSPG